MWITKYYKVQQYCYRISIIVYDACLNRSNLWPVGYNYGGVLPVGQVTVGQQVRYRCDLWLANDRYDNKILDQL